MKLSVLPLCIALAAALPNPDVPDGQMKKPLRVSPALYHISFGKLRLVSSVSWKHVLQMQTARL